MTDRQFDRFFPWLCSIVSLGLIANFGYERWQIGDKHTASLAWLALLPMSILLYTLIWVGQTINDRYEDNPKNDRVVDEPVKQNV